MKLAFFVSTPVRFTVATPEEAPLGGTESCAAYLSRQMAARGHDVTLIATLPPQTTAERIMGVRHVAMKDVTIGFFGTEDFDAVITLTNPGQAQALKKAAPNAFHVAWLHLGSWEPAMAQLQAMTPFIDCAVFVSAWQRGVAGFTGASHVIGNGIAPSFENMFASAEALAAAKQNRAVYASLPERGLALLAEAFAAARIETALDIYSGRSLYQQPDEPWPARLATLPRAHPRPPVSQTALAAAMRQAAFLTYPAIGPETWCIVASEAMAAGMKVISTAIAALPEATMGMAELMPLAEDDTMGAIARRFTLLLERNEAEFLGRRREWAEARFAQSLEANRRFRWAVRAKEWEDFLAPAIAAKRGA